MSDNKNNKCPECGNLLDSFVGKCDACGHEIVNNRVNETLAELVDKLELEIYQGKGANFINRENLIKTFPIPNNKKDIFEMLIFYDSRIRKDNCSLAYQIKLKELIVKSKILFKNDTSILKDLQRFELSLLSLSSIEKLFTNIRTFRRRNPFLSIMINCGISIIITIVVLIIIGGKVDKKMEEKIVIINQELDKIEQLVIKKEYKQAYLDLSKIDYVGEKTEKRKKALDDEIPSKFKRGEVIRGSDLFN